MTTYAELVDRFYANPRRHKEPFELTWAEFCWVWNEQRLADRDFVKPRPPAPSDVEGAMIFGRPIVITDHPLPPVPEGKLRLLGGPRSYEIIVQPKGCARIVMPSVWPSYDYDGQTLRQPTIVGHIYDAVTGLYLKGRMPTNRINWPTPTLFSKRTERILAWLDR